MKNIYILTLVLIISLPMFAQSELPEEIQKGLIDRHNKYRQEQGAPDLQWSDDLASKAQEWANVIAKKDQLIHSDFDYGENVFVSSYIPSPNEVVDLWADEQQFYNGEKISNQNFQLFGHYTQIIWTSTTHIGCAEAVSKKGNHYWVCEYDPAGNYLNEKPVPNYKKKQEVKSEK